MRSGLKACNKITLPKSQRHIELARCFRDRPEQPIAARTRCNPLGFPRGWIASQISPPYAPDRTTAATEKERAPQIANLQMNPSTPMPPPAQCPSRLKPCGGRVRLYFRFPARGRLAEIRTPDVARAHRTDNVISRQTLTPNKIHPLPVAGRGCICLNCAGITSSSCLPWAPDAGRAARASANR